MLKICDAQQLMEKAQQLDQIVCFGAGKRLELLENLFINTCVWKKIRCIVDNGQDKLDTTIIIKGKEFEILSIDQLKQRNYHNFAIIITCVRYEEVAAQLDADDVLNGIDYYCLSHIRLVELEKGGLQKEIPSQIRLSEAPLIPKVIHFCWFGRKPIPDKYRTWMESWHRFCPDYKVVEWNEDNYDITKIAFMSQAYEKGKWGFVSDYARLDIIYNYGGIYFDTDVELVQGVDDLLYQRGFAGFQSNGQVNFGLGFGAVKGLPLIKEIMDLYDGMEFINQDGSLNMIACPILQTQVLKKHGLHTDGEYQIVDGLTVFPEKMLCGKGMFTRRTVLKPYTRAIHHFDASWAEGEIRNRNMQLEKEMEQCTQSDSYGE